MLESWFLDWLMGHRGLSPQTVASYRDAFRLLRYLEWVLTEMPKARSATSEDHARL